MNTPSIGLDQNGNRRFIDRYIGRVPKFIHRIPEAEICDVNPDYIRLLIDLVDGTIDSNNLSDELMKELQAFLNLYADANGVCKMSDEDKSLLTIFKYYMDPKEAPWANPPPACKTPDNWVHCNDMVCCSNLYSCSDDAIPTP